MESTERPSPERLLQYHPDFPVLICNACRYAVQPSGIARHLKEIHHIYRSHRRPYMKHASRFKLADPKDIIQTTIDEFPVRLLPVLDGLQCLGSETCEYLCVSSKRMQKHWLSVHGRHGGPQGDWKPAPLQTFFRGNLLHYFTNSKTRTRLKESVIQSICPADVIGQLDELDQSLFHHYVASTSLTLVDVHGTQDIWQQTIPQMAQEHPFLMHALLACSALHLVCKYPSGIDYLVRGHDHQDVAMPLFRYAITHVTESNCHSILAFSHLLIIYSFASGHVDERLLVVSPSSKEPEMFCSWLYFIRNSCLLVCDYWDAIEEGPLAPLIGCWESPMPDLGGTIQSKVTSHLLAVLPAGEKGDDATCNVYRETAELLGSAMEAAQALRGQDFTAWDVIRVWPMEISAAYVELLPQQDPTALVLLAHYCLLLEMAQPRWYMEGRSKSLLSAVMERLDPEWHGRIRKSFEEIKSLLSQFGPK